jgi:hypothetical protein
VAATWRAVQIVLGNLAVLLLIGVAVLVVGEEKLGGVVETIEQRFARAFWVGVLAELAAIPLLALGALALFVSLLGIPLIPVYIVLYVLAVAGIVTLGFLAAARVTGAALTRGRGTAATARGATLRALLGGLALYLGLWLLAAAFTWSPIVGAVLRGVALAASWAAATVGLGAVILSRAGTRRAAERPAPVTPPADELVWQTPTPIGGVVAARRPTPAPPFRER